jgi:hypothetical protein
MENKRWTFEEPPDANSCARMLALKAWCTPVIVGLE